MSRQKQESDLGILLYKKGISLRDMATILETGKKLTRGAKNQLKVNSIQREQGEKQSEMSFDSRKSIETRKDNKKNEKQVKKKESLKVSVPQQLPHYLGVPNLQKYLASNSLEIQTSYEISKHSIVELGKNYFPSLIRVLLRNNLTKELYQVKRGELKRQKTTKDQFLIEFQHYTTNRNEVRSITRQNGIVLIGQNIAMLKLNFEQWKQIFSQEIDEIRRQFQSSNERFEQSVQKQELPQKKQAQKGQFLEQKVLIDQNCPQKIQQQKSLEFIQIKPNPDRQFTLQNEINESLENNNDGEYQNQGGKIRGQSYKIQQERFEDSRMIPQGQQQEPKIGLSQQQIFKRFCFPECEFMLWPVIIYDTGLGDEEELERVVESGKYNFSEKDKTRLFEMISKSNNGLFVQNRGFDTLKKSIKEKEKLISYFETVIRPKIENKWLQQKKKGDLGSQLNLIIYPIGLNRLVRFRNRQQLELYPMDLFNEQQFLTSYIFTTLLKQTAQQLCSSIQKLNEFSQLQVTETKSQDIRSSIDRLVKCQIDNKVYKGIVLRYSNLQKKMLVMVFKEGVRNELRWVGVEQVYCNYTLPQISTKSKFLLYDTNEQNPNYNSLLELFNDIYAHYLHKQTHNNNNNSNNNSNPHSSNSNNSSNQQQQIQQYQQQQSLPLITRPSIPNRCTTCYYPIHRLAYYKCHFCDNYSHQQCSQKTINKSIQLNCSNVPNLWTCDHCEPCVVCLQPLKNQTISCSKCHTNLHQVCAKLKLQQNLIRDKYSCQNCIQCKICQKKLKNLDYVLIKNGYQCINCYKAQQANQICHICKKQSDGRWAQCSRQFCGKWIHKNCDKYIQTRNNLFSSNNEEVYYCPFCRCIEKRRLILKFIETISIFDEYQYFISSDYEDILDYKYVIPNPMCFRKMYERCYEGCYDVNTLTEIKRDFELIVSNALKYNMPKDQPHYQARILNVLGQFAFEKFREELECTEQQIIRGGLMQRMIEKKKQMYKQVYERYLEIILNFGAKWSTVEVKRPKQNVKAIQKMSTMQLTELQQYGFNSKLLLKDVFRSAMIKFKLKKKPATIQNLFETQKVIEAYKSNINANYCYYHYWNSNTKYYCKQCMEYYCCVEKCYRHEICRYCGVKGCACDVYQCGCGVMKEKDRKYYEKLLVERFYDRREITQNYKLCLKCAFQKLNNKQCTYCEKSYEFYYDFETCKQCKRIYHKQCADQHASQSLSKFFFKQKPSQAQLFSTTLRLSQHCYECSINKGNKSQMFEKLKRQSLQKLAKIQKLSKYQLLIVSILFENGIKLSLCDVLGLIMDNYQQFLSFQNIFEQYRINYASMKFNQKLNNKLHQRLQHVVKTNIICKGKRQQEIEQMKERILCDVLENSNSQLIKRGMMILLSQQIVDSIVVNNLDSLWSVKRHYNMLSRSVNGNDNLNNRIASIMSIPLTNNASINTNNNYNKDMLLILTPQHNRTQLMLERFQQIRNRHKALRIMSDNCYVGFNNILASSSQQHQQHISKRGGNGQLQQQCSINTVGGNNHNNNNNNNNNSTNNNKSNNRSQHNNNNKNHNHNNHHNNINITSSEISKQITTRLLFDIIHNQYVFNTLQEIQINKINSSYNRNIDRDQIVVARRQQYAYSYMVNGDCYKKGSNNKRITLLVDSSVSETVLVINIPNKCNQALYQINHYHYQQEQQFKESKDKVEKIQDENQQQQQQGGINNNNNNIQQQQQKQQQKEQIDIEQALQQAIQQKQHFNANDTNDTIKQQNKIINLQQKLSNIHSNHANISKLSKYTHLSQIHSIITKFILKCFQYSKSVYRRGNTCLLKTEKDHWRLLKKCQHLNQTHGGRQSDDYQNQYQNQNQNHYDGNFNNNNFTVHQISLKKENNKWFFSINQNTWWVETIEQIIHKLKIIVNLNNFRQLADFLGFTFRLVPLQKANHFSKFLRSHPLDNLSAKDKKKLVVDLYDKFQWAKNGFCKNKITQTINNGQQTVRQEIKQYVTAKKNLFYLGRRKKTEQQNITTVKQKSSQPYITYEDMKRDLEDISGHPSQRRRQLEPKQYIINESRVFIGPSPIHKLGLFAKQNYPKFTTMIEYIGEIVSESTADVRETIFHFGCYMFGLNRRNVDRREIIDATFRGNMARYLNHSCDPNCKAKIQLINNQPKIFIYSIRDIHQFQQLTYDYQFSVDANQKLTCTCGAKNCQGRLN